MNISESLVVMEYTTTPRFRQIERHTAVAREDGSLVAVTGPAGDAESEAYARLFAASPGLLAALREIADLAGDIRLMDGSYLSDHTSTAIAKAHSMS